MTRNPRTAVPQQHLRHLCVSVGCRQVQGGVASRVELAGEVRPEAEDLRCEVGVAEHGGNVQGGVGAVGWPVEEELVFLEELVEGVHVSGEGCFPQPVIHDT
ncbi:ankyrin repeat-containing protein-like [Iris pallida]|uniref:Ankyrin repeat-containing protein-like n=1 Tax=Iris pallida TaxID=29817 RepID=A0AAX6G7G4_IRIPA|nr:ankyrin repeat-containing protein-like [Iris pallida]